MKRLAPLALLAPLLLTGCPSRSNPAPAAPTPADLAAAQKTWPDATADELARGHAGVVANCHSCHGHPNPRDVSRAEWPATAERMVRRSNVAEADRQAVIRFLVARAAATP